MAICLTAGRSGWLGRDGDRCINVIPRHPPFIQREAMPACKNLLHEIYDGPEGTE